MSALPRVHMVLSRIRTGVFVVFLFGSQVGIAETAQNDSCDCPKLSCNTECEIEQDLTFYTEKCANGQRVKSCSRPTCIKMAHPPASCGVVMNGATPPKSSDLGTEREVASTSVEAEVVGRVQFIEGNVKKVVGATEKVDLNVGDEIREKDRIQTDKTGKLQIKFNSGNVLNITPNSEVGITEATDSKPNFGVDKKRMVLDLIKGKVRNKVNQKYNGEESYYRVRTGAAVAGVRGTDFVMSAFDENENAIAKIETLEGKVELSDKDFKDKAVVAPGEGATYVSPLAITDKNKAEFVSQGHLTPVYKLSAEEVAVLASETEFALPGAVKKIKRASRAANEKTICANPTGQMNQCAWICENNPAGEGTCRTDLPQVSCVRRMCNANGEWSGPTRLPSSYSESCAPNKPVVKPCDY